ncbi:MAG: alpha/beta hydrolase, partial [Actinomycetota bacterium]
DLCKRADVMIISVNYRHAPEARFPAAVDDAWDALTWVADNAQQLGGSTDRIAVAGWSAGGNLAAVVAQMARDNGGPALRGQLLLTPVTDGSRQSASYTENGEGYVLTKNVMEWFWNHYASAEDRKHVKASPLLAESLANLPPAMIVTGQFDPLRDEGNAYARALVEAGVKVKRIQARGHIHTSITMVDMLPSGRAIRAHMASGLREFFVDK